MAGDETRLLKEGGADFITNFILTLRPVLYTYFKDDPCGSHPDNPRSCLIADVQESLATL